MNRNNQITRNLAILLAIVVVAGGGVYWIAHRTPKNHAVHHAAADATTPAQSPTTHPAEERLASDVVVTQLPTAPPAAPARTAVAETPATHPATEPARVIAPAPILTSDSPLRDGKAMLDKGDLIGGRKMLNDALIAGRLSPADTAAAKALIAEANQKIVFSPQRFSNDPFAMLYNVPSGAVLTKIAAHHDSTPDFLCRINGLADARRLRANANIKIIPGPFHAVVSKSTFTMDIYLGSPGGPESMYITSFPVGLGKDDSTPTGTWMVDAENKLKDPVYYSPRGEGVVPADDPKNPLGKFWIGLTGAEGDAVGKTSYGIHGNCDPDSIGKQSSMGCIRMRNDDIPLVYELLVGGKSTVVVKP